MTGGRLLTTLCFCKLGVVNIRSMSGPENYINDKYKALGAVLSHTELSREIKSPRTMYDSVWKVRSTVKINLCRYNNQPEPFSFFLSLYNSILQSDSQSTAVPFPSQGH